MGKHQSPLENHPPTEPETYPLTVTGLPLVSLCLPESKYQDWVFIRALTWSFLGIPSSGCQDSQWYYQEKLGRSWWVIRKLTGSPKPMGPSGMHGGGEERQDRSVYKSCPFLFLKILPLLSAAALITSHLETWQTLQPPNLPPDQPILWMIFLNYKSALVSP